MAKRCAQKAVPFERDGFEDEQERDDFRHEPENVAAIRSANIDRLISDGDVDSDSTWFLPLLTDRQIRYGQFYLRFQGDWQKAAKEVGYSAKTRQEDIESSDAMVAYMTAIKAEVARALGITSNTIINRINRIGLKAERNGDLPTALKATKMLGDTLGLFQDNTVKPGYDANGEPIVISATRTSGEDEIVDAVWEEVMEANALPERTDG